jgi:hypothetical protein
VAGAATAQLKEEADDGYLKKGSAYTPPTKPKTGKAALPFKKDRVISFVCSYILFHFSFTPFVISTRLLFGQ